MNDDHEREDVVEIPMEEESVGSNQAQADVTASALSLLIGGIAETTDLLRHWVQGEEATQAGSEGATRYVAIGLTRKTAKSVDRGMRVTAAASRRLGHVLFAPGRAVLGSRSLKPFRRGFDHLVARGEASVETWRAQGKSTETEGRRAARAVFERMTNELTYWLGEETAVAELIDKQVVRIVPELAEVPEIDAVIQELANTYITYLNEHPELVQALIKEQGDVYIAYLNEHPEQVQSLVQGQSKGLVSEMTDEVRARTVTADSVFETLARKLLRRGERAHLFLAAVEEEPAPLSEESVTEGETAETRTGTAEPD